jgi:hypothetical protein
MWFVQAALAVAASAAVAAAQVPAGPEFRVNTYTTNGQSLPSGAMAADGRFILAWGSAGQDDFYGGVFAQRFDTDGSFLGSEFRVNTYTTQGQGGPAVVGGRDGHFIVTWTSMGQDGSSTGVFGQRFDRTGAPLGSEFRAHEFTGGPQQGGYLAMDAAGNFVVVWSAYDPSNFGAYGRRFNSDGTPRGSDFRVNTYTWLSQGAGSIAMSSGGEFVVTWNSDSQDGSSNGVFARRYHASGLAAGPEFRVNSYTTASQFGPLVTMDGGGNFVIVWQSEWQDGSFVGVFGQRFDAMGTQLGAEFRVNTTVVGNQESPSIGADEAGNFLVVWSSLFPGGLRPKVFGQRFDVNGAPRGAEFQISGPSDGGYPFTSLAMDPAGNFIVAWDNFPDGDRAGIGARRYGGLLPAGLEVDASGNHVWEPGELIALRPTWRNANGATQTFGGVLSSIAGSPGATYAISDNTADYGSVPNSATATCTDCYAVSVSNPPSRPVLHWDASALETVTPDSSARSNAGRCTSARVSRMCLRVVPSMSSWRSCSTTA